MAKSAATRISEKLEKAKLTAETKEIFSMLVSYFDSVLGEKDKKIGVLEEKVVSLQNQVQKLENIVDENSQYERRDTFIISGQTLPISRPNEDSKEVVKTLFREHLRMNIDTNDLSTAHRIGRIPNGEDRRSIIVKACRRDLIREIFLNCKQVKPPFYVNPALTPTRGKIMYLLRKLKQKYPRKIKACRSYNGEPKAIINLPPRTRNGNQEENKKFVSIVTREDLENFAINDLGTTLEEAGLTW